MKDCIFCKISRQQIKTEFIFKDRDVVVLKDINPKAEIHLLIVPKRHIESINYLRSKDKELAGKMLLTAKKIARIAGASSGSKLIFNVGQGGGQIIDHLHLHLLSGKIRGEV